MPWRALLLWPAVLLLSLLLRLLRGPLPPGLESPRRLRLLEAANLLLASLAWLGSRLGLGSQVLLMRRLRESVLRPSHARPDDPAVAVRNTRIDGVPVRIYTPRRVAGGETAAGTHRPRPTIIFFHGGGWMFGSVDSYDHVTKFLVKRTGAELISVEYRLAPEHPFPVPLGDCVRVARSVLGGGTVGAAAAAGPVALCGDSAGGNLATAVALTLARDARTGRRGLVKPLPSAQPVALALLYPSLQMIDLNLVSHAQSDSVPVLSRARTAAFCLAYIGAPQELVPAVLKGLHSSPRHRAGLRALVQEEEEEAAVAAQEGGEEGAAHGFTASTREDPSVGRMRRRMRKMRRSQPGGVTPCRVPGATHGAVGDAGGKASEYYADGGGVGGGGVGGGGVGGGGTERGFAGFASGIGEGGYGVYDTRDDDRGVGGGGGGNTTSLAAADSGAERRPPPGLSSVARACLDPLLCPLAVGDGWLRRLPRRLLVLSCEHDVLRDEARALAARARRCGLHVTRHHAAHGFHGVLNFYGRDERGVAAGWPGGDGGDGGGVDGGPVRDGGDGGGVDGGPVRGGGDGGADGRVRGGGVGAVDVHGDDDDGSGGGGRTRTRHVAATNDNNPAAAAADDDDADDDDDDDESSDRAADDDDDSDDDDDDDDGGGGGGDGAERPPSSGPCWLCAWFWPSPVCWLCSRPIIAFRCGEEALEATAAFLRRSLAAAVRHKKTK
ncbi:uncharacterized protein LOC116951369 [Petromyzon marinus]|uniref:Hormone-sensitive lipase-like n=1 Tax=Petromyzon marinus TaxID=7757 RepID=A0AAJ7TX25_PETMA|nr:hormone-sensitive lipase-like [Petromyzon marinus]